MSVDSFKSGCSRFRAVLFDLDGTLADSAQCGVLATHAAFDAFGLKLPSRTEIVNHMGIPIEDSFPLMAPDLTNVSRRDQVIARFRAEYAALADQHISLFPGVIPMLDDLRSCQIPLAIVTSKHVPVAVRNITVLGILEYFQAIVGPEMVLRPKPAPDTSLHALAMLGLPASSDILVVGDASFDILMGRNAGLATCAVGWGAHSLAQLAEAEPTFRASTMGDLHDLVIRRSAADLAVVASVQL